jgi:hypothetical protein
VLDRADVRTKLSTLFTVVRPKARHNHPMTVRGFETADGLCQATGVPYTAIGTMGGDARHVSDLFDVRLDELRAVHEATLPVAFER